MSRLFYAMVVVLLRIGLCSLTPVIRVILQQCRCHLEYEVCRIVAEEKNPDVPYQILCFITGFNIMYRGTVSQPKTTL